jgi:hypothetical protein
MYDKDKIIDKDVTLKVYMYIHTYTRMHTHIIHKYIHMHTYIHTYAHTHTYQDHNAKTTAAVTDMENAPTMANHACATKDGSMIPCKRNACGTACARLGASVPDRACAGAPPHVKKARVFAGNARAGRVIRVPRAQLL